MTETVVALALFLVAATTLVLAVVPYMEGLRRGDPYICAAMGSVPWWFYKLGAKHRERRYWNAKRRLKEWR